MQQIKLVIWDLDETFWQGTLSEGPVTLIEKNCSIVRTLNRRGIVSSICSKNTFEDARVRLEQAGMWDSFVFPRIAWAPKGQLISEIITDMQLRAPNVLFVDDNPGNLEEAKFYNPDLQTATPEILETILDLDACKGKNDEALSRLNQYKILEQKQAEKQRTGSSNEDFLRSSGIRVRISTDCLAEQNRILEMINRTNQLNYTKIRLQEDELETLLNDASVEAAYVRVADNYGDYGICGFYAARGGRLLHFLFSCRILNMGVENWLYNKLQCPDISIDGECATPLRAGSTPDWITEESGDEPLSTGDQKSESPWKKPRILIKGGCDLEQIGPYLTKGLHLDTEFTRVSQHGLSVHGEHTEILKRCNRATIDTYGHIIDRLMFLDRQAYTTDLLNTKYDIYIYSVLQDYSQGLYRYRDTDFIVPYGDVTVDITDSKNRAGLINAHRKKKRFSPEFLEWFQENFTFLGGETVASFKENINWLCTTIDKQKTLILMNGSEVVYPKNPQQNRWEHHARMNRALEDIVKGHEHAVICDVRRFLQEPEHHSNNLRHYNRYAYYQLANSLNALIQERFTVKYGFLEKELRCIAFYADYVYRNLKRKLFKEILPLKG